jgi:hypothetical protein
MFFTLCAMRFALCYSSANQYMHGHYCCFSGHVSAAIFHQARIGRGIDLPLPGLPAHLPDDLGNLG